ncbi:hypothetical protein KYK30_04995 [Shinella yambaruensis]|uniref:Membrane protein n=1 Tax=Shinella yambaruensis TaxID=415996 RepID=A0ABQ5ZSD1_9HYPH|nr:MULTISPECIES: hypothetical protein [Shinella]MCJ8023817.1 hypothetical protein [Shinella yambaruensis]MCU7979033.1 hypothetical protein [Shinella yambaruensis]MCW5706119.1 hypothetical protein [Shinella sp.]GLR54260.1 membrane protein [Shinella yambaruensis]
MIRIALASFAALFLAACTTGTPRAVEPIPGSITYGGQPRTKLTKAPIGSTFEHTFIDRYGRPVVETYRIQPDRSLLLIHRYTRIEYF